MTQCSECLDALSTASLDDIKPGTAIAVHAATCYGCAAALEEVTLAEQRLEESLANLRSSHPPYELARAAHFGGERHRRKALARVLRVMLVFAAIGVVIVFFGTRRMTPNGEPVPTTMMESFTLECLTARQAADLAAPYLRSKGSGVVYRSDELKTVTIRGSVDEFVAAKRAIARFEEPGKCTLPPPDVVAPPPPPVDAAAKAGAAATPDGR